MYSSIYTTLTGAIANIRNRAIDKRDYLVPLSEIRPSFDGHLSFRGMGTEASPTFHGQLAETLGIPVRYYHRMRTEAPQLWRDSVNTWLDPLASEEKLVRSYSGDYLRALLSPSFARIDHEAVLDRLEPILGDGRADLELKAFDFSSDRLSLKLISPKIEGEITKGDVVRVGLEIANSETGHGVVQITPLVYRLVCTNGMIAGSALGEIRRRHKGARAQVGMGSYLLPSASESYTQAQWWQSGYRRIERILSEDGAQEIFAPLRTAAEMIIPEPTKALKAVIATYRLDDREEQAASADWEWSPSRSVWALSNVVTALANTAESYERASELEAAGWDIATNPKPYLS